MVLMLDSTQGVVSRVGRDEGGNGNHAGVEEQISEFADAPDVFGPVTFRESEVAAQAMPHVVAIGDVGDIARGEQPLFEGMRASRFAGTGQAGDPDQCAAMAVSFGAQGTGAPLLSCW